MHRKFSPTPYLFLAPALIMIAIFVLDPIVSVDYYRFTDYSIVTPPVWVGLKNFQRLFQDPIFWQALSHSFIYFLVTPTLIFLCVVLAVVANRKLPGINLFRALYYIPVISGSKVTGPQVHDARVAALCQHHRVRELWTADRDLSRFAGITTRNPLVR